MTTERPKWNDEIRKELSEKVGNILHEWSNESDDLEKCIADSFKVLNYNYNEDGYVLAKAFEDEGYDSYSSLVDDLDYVSSEYSAIVKTHVQKWVDENKLTLTHQLNQEVKFSSRGEKSGTVVRLFPETFEYGIRTPDQSNTSYYVIKAELVS